MFTIDKTSTDNIQKLYHKYSDMVFRVGVLYMKNEQEAYDIVQEVFLKFLKHSKQFQDEEHEKAWFLRVAINSCKDQLKSHWRKKRVSWNDYQNGAELTAGDITAKSNGNSDMKHIVLSAVMNLPDIYKDVIFLYYYEGYSTEEIAQIVHRNPSTIRSRLQKARELLKKSLKEE